MMNDNKKKRFAMVIFTGLGLCLVFMLLSHIFENSLYANNLKTGNSIPRRTDSTTFVDETLRSSNVEEKSLPATPSALLTGLYGYQGLPFMKIVKSITKNSYFLTDNTSTTSTTGDIDTMNPLRITYKTDFYYEPLADSIKESITGISYQENSEISYEDLRYLSLLYIDFDGQIQTGELICNQAIAQDLIEIFYELYQASYPIEKIRLVDEYQGDDELSMLDNNTSAFNYRTVAGTTTLSKHALGLAIDINPFYNPYVTNLKGPLHISPVGSEIYADRSQSFAHKIDENDLCYQLFIEHGFTWGGSWKNSKDYQHFQKAID